MSNFIVSARKYRPQLFREVVGQQQVTDTLRNALKSNHLAQSFLFCGPRGVGKTTCARILAKAINCEQPSADMEPCNQCNSCQSFNAQTSFNIHELDAASNNGVDEMRSLIEQVRFPPQAGRYKVYIIDEVHMLSQSAFNAFLKTLEEPPPYAVFILATTEKHKIIPTILSRCQIFDFKRIGVEDIKGHLRHICAEEGIEAEEAGLHVIAQKADGALRDALTVFDKISSFTGKKIAYKDVIENLNILDYEYYFKVTDYLLTEDSPAVLLSYNDVLARGFEGDTFMLGLAEHFRNLLMCKDEATLPLLEASSDLTARYREQALIADESFLLNALDLAAECDASYKLARNKRLHVEIALLKICFLSTALDLGKPVINEPDDLKKKRPQPAPAKPADVTPSQPAAATQQAAPATTASAPSAERPSVAPEREPVELAPFELDALAEIEARERQAAETGSGEPETDAMEELPPDEFNDSEAMEDGDEATDFADAEEPSEDDLFEDDGLEAEAEGRPSAAGQSVTRAPATPPPAAAQGGDLLSELQAAVASGKIQAVRTDSNESLPLTLEAAREAWKKLLLEHAAELPANFITTAKALLPDTEGDTEVVVTVDSNVARGFLMDQAQFVKQFYRDYFNRGDLHFRVDFVAPEEGEEGPKIYLNPKEQFEAMAKENPTLFDLQKRFDLDIEY